jgi:hypothetical protein
MEESQLTGSLTPTHPATNEARLLGITIPAIPEIIDILLPILKKYNIPKILPENKELSKTVIAERTQEEWVIIRDEIEFNLREKITILSPELIHFYKRWKKQPDEFLRFKELEKLPAFIKKPLTQLFTALLECMIPSFQIVEQIYISLSNDLFDYLREGRPINIPNYLFGEAMAFTHPSGEKVVIAFASRLVNPSYVAKRFHDRIIETFGERPEITEDTIKGAEYWTLEKYGISRSEIALIDMDRFPKSKRRYRKIKYKTPPLVRRKKNIDKSIERSIDTISKIVGDNK